MPVYRGPDGKIIEESTRSVSSSSSGQNAGKSNADIDGKTRRLSSRPVPPPSSKGVSGGNEAAEVDDVKDISGVTKAFKGTSAKQTSETQDVDDPVVGWLVVVGGAGLGASFALGYGANSIGRGDGERVTLNYGDKQISRASHATLTYDPKSRKFFIQGGGGRNLTYLDDEVILTPTELNDKSTIQVGETNLKFVSFCGEDFDWQN
ncbi:MAG: FHA domain-containing protein [Sphingomonadales bacterium]|nr:FHA domain-containing protein [Sphingomonadales bacterium]